jgi:hypothetical protein
MATNPTDISGVITRKGKFHNGWTEEQEDLMEKWADMAACYRWLHDRCEKQYSNSNMSMTIPVIVLSTLTGTASVGLGSLVGDNPDSQKYAQIAIGGVSLIAGILTTLGNFFKYAQLSESNRVAGISWGKFQRQIAVELSLHPNDRLDSMDFIKICRAELDRLIEQSPAIPDGIVSTFMKEFKDLPNLKRPDICKGIEHTESYKDKKSRFKQIASEAAVMMYHKKKVLRDEIIPDIDNRLTKIMDTKIDELRRDLGNRGSDPQLNGPSGTSMNITSILPQIGQKKVSAYEPEWRKLVRRTNDTPAPTESDFLVENPMRRRDDTSSLSNIVVTVDTPTSTK